MAQKPANRPFVGLLDAITIDAGAVFQFDGAIDFAYAANVWTWLCRDVAPDLLKQLAANPAATASEVEAVMPEVLTRARQIGADASANGEVQRRLKLALGGEETLTALPSILYALRSRALIDKAQTFGRAVNNCTDDSGLALALQSMPLQDAKAAALLMQAAIGQITNPTRVVTTAVRLAGQTDEKAMARSGFGPLIDAILSNAQSQIPLMRPSGIYADIDLICGSIERFHKMMRSLNGYVEFARGSRWAGVIAGLTKSASEAIEPKLRDVIPDVIQSLRRPREGMDRLDEDKLLSALNGVYLLATLRECRDSLALNALYDQAWAQTGTAIETHLTRNLDIYRDNPADVMAAKRLDTGIKMAELRFNADYAEVLRRARDAAGRRLPSTPATAASER